MTRAVAPVVGALALLGITVVLAATIGIAVFGLAPGDEQPPAAAVDVALDSNRTIILEHAGGDEIDVEALEVTILVDGEPIPFQPPVPFAGAEGYFGAPLGPFNVQSDDQWSTGERAGLVFAGENAVVVEAGETLEVRLVVHETVVATPTADL